MRKIRLVAAGLKMEVSCMRRNSGGREGAEKTSGLRASKEMVTSVQKSQETEFSQQAEFASRFFYSARALR